MFDTMLDEIWKSNAFNEHCAECVTNCKVHRWREGLRCWEHPGAGRWVEVFESKFHTAFPVSHPCTTAFTVSHHEPGVTGLGEHRTLDPRLGKHSFTSRRVTCATIHFVTTRVLRSSELRVHEEQKSSSSQLSQLISSGHLISIHILWSFLISVYFIILIFLGSWWITFTWLHLIIHSSWGCKPHRLGPVPRSAPDPWSTKRKTKRKPVFTFFLQLGLDFLVTVTQFEYVWIR